MLKRVGLQPAGKQAACRARGTMSGGVNALKWLLEGARVTGVPIRVNGVPFIRWAWFDGPAASKGHLLCKLVAKL